MITEKKIKHFVVLLTITFFVEFIANRGSANGLGRIHRTFPKITFNFHCSLFLLSLAVTTQKQLDSDVKKSINIIKHLNMKVKSPLMKYLIILLLSQLREIHFQIFCAKKILSRN